MYAVGNTVSAERFARSAGVHTRESFNAYKRSNENGKLYFEDGQHPERVFWK